MATVPSELAWAGNGDETTQEGEDVNVPSGLETDGESDDPSTASTATLSLLKLITGEADAVDSATEFPITATWLDAEGVEQSVDLVINTMTPTPLGADLPAGTIVTITEGVPPALTTVDWGSITITGDHVTDNGDGTATVVVSDQQDDVTLITVTNEAKLAPAVPEEETEGQSEAEPGLDEEPGLPEPEGQQGGIGLFSLPAASDSQTIPAGALIVDFGGNGGLGRTLKNQLRPFGFVQDLLLNYQIPVLWVIADGKSADSDVDFSAVTQRLKPAGTTTTRNYSTGAFIIMPEYVPFITAAINQWGATGATNNTDGVVIDKATEAFTAPVYGKVQGWPRTVLDAENGNIAGGFYDNAGIGYNAKNTNVNAIDYRKPYFKAPSALTACDDLYVMPHADPTVGTHRNLRLFNEQGGYIWAGCHAVSVLENMSGTVGGVTYPLGYFSFLSTNGLVPFDGGGKHENGTPPYTSTVDRSDPIMQFWGKIDLATTNGSEQIYLPTLTSAWRDTSRVLTWDPDHPNLPGGNKTTLSNGPAAVMVYGRGFGDSDNGMVMYQGGHNLNVNNADGYAAQRAFLNFNLMGGLDRGLTVTATADKTQVNGGETVALAATPAGGTPAYRYQWTSTCGGSFSDATAQNPVFTAPVGQDPVDCLLRVQLRDDCDRFAVDAIALSVLPATSELTIGKGVDVGKLTPVVAGQTVTYTLTFTKAGALSQDIDYTDHLAGVVDDAVINQSSLAVVKDPNVGTVVATFNPAGDQLRVTGTMPAAGVVTVTFTATVKADGQRGDSLLGNFLVLTGQNPPTECPPVSTTCTANPVSYWTVDKTAAPESGSWVSAGQEITYQVTATSLKGAIEEVILTDDLAGVLSHATFVPGSAELSINNGAPEPVDDPVGATLATDPFVLPPSGTAVLSYRVVINEDARLVTVTNSAYGTAVHTVNPDDPSPTTQDLPPMSCADDQPCTTEHSVLGEAFIEKWGTPSGSDEQQPIDGSAFELRRDDSGAPAEADPDDPLLVVPVTGVTGRFSAYGLKPGDTYWLIETRAPSGHSLLAQPIAFSLDSDGAITIHSAALNPQATVTGDAQDTIRVTDIAAIPLPIAGGLGVNLLVFGLLLAAAAGIVGWVIRRQIATPSVPPA